VHFFVYILHWASRKRYFFVRARQRKKFAKNSGSIASVALRGNNFIPAEQGVGRILLQGGQG
jgi:hypothetical protein